MKTNQIAEFYLNFSISGEKKTEVLNFEHSNHSIKRAAQRGITSEMIGLVIEYGRAFFKQGYIFYVLGDKAPKGCKQIEKDWKKYRNLIVMVSGSDNRIITCYRNTNPFHYIRKKTKINIPEKSYTNVA